MRPLRRLIEFLIDRHIASSGKIRGFDTLKRAKIAVSMSTAYAFCGILFAPLFYVLGSPAGAAAILLSDIFILFTPWVMKSWGELDKTAAHWISFHVYWLLAVLACVNGGHGAPSLAWLILIPVAATLLGGRTAGVTWFAACAAQLLAFYVLDMAGVSFPEQVSPEGKQFIEAVSLTALACLAVNIALVYDHFNTEAQNIILGLSAYDEETRTLNQRGFLTLAKQQIRIAGRDKKGYAVFAFRLHGIELAKNDPALGDPAQTIFQGAWILAATFRSSDLLARVGEDVFAVSAAGIDPEELDLVQGRLILNLDRYNREKKPVLPVNMFMNAVTTRIDRHTSIEDLLQKARAGLDEKVLAAQARTTP